MNSAPNFSVVVAAYNAARTLPATIRSVLAQTRSDFELIVVDDGSTDGTADAARDAQDERVLYVPQQNLGPAAARNAGIAKATGTLVSFLDSDDLWHPTFLDSQMSILKDRRTIDVVTGNAYNLGGVRDGQLRQGKLRGKRRTTGHNQDGEAKTQDAGGRRAKAR